MATCSSCGNTIIFGGVRRHEQRYCSKKCAGRDFYAAYLEDVPVELIDEEVAQRFVGPCPICGGQGPVDCFSTYHIYSLGLFTHSSEKNRIGCRRCEIKRKSIAASLCFLFGWWGIPVGLILTPIYITRNLIGVFHCSIGEEPSQRLYTTIHKELAAQLAREIKKDQAPSG